MCIAHWFTSLSTLARYDEPGLNLALRILILHCYQVRPHSSVLRWWVHKRRNSTVRRLSIYIYIYTSRLCRTLFGYCPQPALGSRKADMKTLWFFFPTPYPCNVARKQLPSPDIMGGRAACACALHPFLLCPEHDNGWVRWRTLLMPTNTSK